MNIINQAALLKSNLRYLIPLKVVQEFYNCSIEEAITILLILEGRLPSDVNSDDIREAFKVSHDIALDASILFDDALAPPAEA